MIKRFPCPIAGVWWILKLVAEISWTLKVAEVTQDVLEAEAEMKAAELALVTARAGDLSTKWVTEVIDEDAERVESGKVNCHCITMIDRGYGPFIYEWNTLG